MEMFTSKLVVTGKTIVVANGFRRDAGNDRPEACATQNRVPLRAEWRAG